MLNPPTRKRSLFSLKVILTVLYWATVQRFVHNVGFHRPLSITQRVVCSLQLLCLSSQPLFQASLLSLVNVAIRSVDAALLEYRPLLGYGPTLCPQRRLQCPPRLMSAVLSSSEHPSTSGVLPLAPLRQSPQRPKHQPDSGPCP